MSKFALEHIPEISGKIKFYKLIIDGKCDYDEFFIDVKKRGNLSAYFRAIVRTLQSVSNNERLPESKFHPLKNCKNQYEVKKDILRIYMIKEDDHYILTFGSYKGNQETDIGKSNNLYNRYINQK